MHLIFHPESEAPVLILTVFQALSFLQTNIALVVSTVAARIISSLFNFYVNKTVVFQKKSNGKIQLIKYYILCVLQMSVSALALVGVHTLFAGNKLVEKIIVDGLLFLISYQIQRIWVFKGE